MSEQERVQKSATNRSAEQTSEPTTAASHDDLTAALDDILNDIDSVLEANAEEFVRGYVQKGGE
jgi:ubiquitin-like protein Pup